MILMMQNFGSKPNKNCNAITDEVIMIYFLYFIKNVFIVNNSPNPAYNFVIEISVLFSFPLRRRLPLLNRK